MWKRKTPSGSQRWKSHSLTEKSEEPVAIRDRTCENAMQPISEWASSRLRSNGSASGNSSLAFGFGNIAAGDRSAAFGLGSVATANTSFAFGYLTKASGFLGVAFGNNNSAAGDTSVSFGHQTFATGDFSASWGLRSAAGGDASAVFRQATERLPSEDVGLKMQGGTSEDEAYVP